MNSTTATHGPGDHDGDVGDAVVARAQQDRHGLAVGRTEPTQQTGNGEIGGKGRQADCTHQLSTRHRRRDRMRVDRWQEVDRIIPVVTEILDEHEAFIHAMPCRAGAYRDRTSLMGEIRREGVDL
jgi:hypothetical protein